MSSPKLSELFSRIPEAIDALRLQRDANLSQIADRLEKALASARDEHATAVFAERVHVASFDHPYGDRIRVFRTAEAAEAWKEEVAAQGWNEYIPLTVDRPVDPAAAAKAYFEWQAEHANDAQYFSVVECPIENDLTPERPVGYRMALISPETDDMVVNASSCMEESLFGTPDDPFDLPDNAMVCGPAAKALSDWIEEQRRTDAWLAQNGVDYRLIGVSAQEAREMGFVAFEDLPPAQLHETDELAP